MAGTGYLVRCCLSLVLAATMASATITTTAHPLHMNDFLYQCDKTDDSIRVDLDAVLQITYPRKGGTSVWAHPVGNTYAVDGSCTSKTERYLSALYDDISVTPITSIRFDFTINSAQLVDLSMSLKYNETAFKDSTSNNASKTVSLSSPLTNISSSVRSYHCHTVKSYQMGDNVQMIIYSALMQGFNMNNSTFSDRTECASMPPNTKSTTTTVPTKSTTTTVPTKSTTTTVPTKSTTTTMHTKSTASTQTTKTTPKSTTSKAPTSTMSPTPEPVMDNKYMAKNKGKICLLFQAGMELKFNFTDAKNETTEYELAIPQQTNTSHLMMTGVCNKESNVLQLAWNDSVYHLSVDMTMTFDEHVKSNFSLSEISVQLTTAGQTEPLHNVTASNLTLFSTGLEAYYSCKSDDDVKLDNYTLLMFKDVKLQGFRQKNETDFYGSVNNCTASGSGGSNATNTIVPIVVGIVLAVMVVIVLIGYVIGRRRARNSPDYEQIG